MAIPGAVPAMTIEYGHIGNAAGPARTTIQDSDVGQRTASRAGPVQHGNIGDPAAGATSFIKGRDIG